MSSIGSLSSASSYSTSSPAGPQVPASSPVSHGTATTSSSASISEPIAAAPLTVTVKVTFSDHVEYQTFSENDLPPLDGSPIFLGERPVTDLLAQNYARKLLQIRRGSAASQAASHASQEAATTSGSASTSSEPIAADLNLFPIDDGHLSIHPNHAPLSQPPPYYPPIQANGLFEFSGSSSEAAFYASPGSATISGSASISSDSMVVDLDHEMLDAHLQDDSALELIDPSAAPVPAPSASPQTTAASSSLLSFFSAPQVPVSPASQGAMTTSSSASILSEPIAANLHGGFCADDFLSFDHEIIDDVQALAQSAVPHQAAVSASQGAMTTSSSSSSSSSAAPAADKL